jgi:hypothetical protein
LINRYDRGCARVVLAQRHKKGQKRVKLRVAVAPVISHVMNKKSKSSEIASIAAILAGDSSVEASTLTLKQHIILMLRDWQDCRA